VEQTFPLRSGGIRRAIPIASLICVVGCTSARVMQTSGSNDPIAIRDVTVVVRPDAISKDQESAFRSYAMSGAIRSALLDEIKRRGKLATSGPTLEFSVTGFRVRSGSTLFLVGVMAGSDHLSGVVTVTDEAGVVKTFEAGARGNDSAYSGLFMWRLSATRRADLFSRMIAKRVVDQL
jgi:hypothetical protein